MDSYSFRESGSLRDSVRSPSERGWGNRDERSRDDRVDTFYRGRSPGYDRSRRSNRSRSPTTLDRYEPRTRREEYAGAGARDRDTRERRIGSPPANIDRYIPGQEGASDAPALTVNPIQDPVKLPFQVGFSYFGEWWRANEKIKEEKERQRTGRRREPERVRGPREAQEERDREKVKIQAAYDSYKEELQAKMARGFVADHKKEQWFRERYVPEVRDAFRKQLNDHRRGNYAQWEQDLEAGVFDDYSLEGLPKSETNGAGGVVEKEEGEATAQNEVLGVSDLVPQTGGEVRDDSLYQPTLLIKTIAPHVSRLNLEAFCKEHLGEGGGGFKWLSLSDPNPSKRYHRIGWVMLNASTEARPVVDRVDPKDEDEDDESKAKVGLPFQSAAEKALEAVNGKTVNDEVRGDFVCHVGVHTPPSNPRKKALWDLFSAPERISKDTGLVRRLINKFEEDFGSDFNAILKIEERIEELRASGRLQAMAPTAPVKKAKKERDLDVAMDEGDEGSIEEGEEEEEEEEGAVEDDDEADDEDTLSRKKQLDLMIEYLRRVFNFCFFCVFESDSIHELTRKCPGGHLRRPRSTLSSAAKAVARATVKGEPFPGRKRNDGSNAEDGEQQDAADEQQLPQQGQRKFRNTSAKTEQQLLRAYNWVRTFEDKIMQILEPESVDLKKLGGKSADEAAAEEMAKFVKQEDEHKWRCKVPECAKLFKEEHFWKKHVEKRHADWLDVMKQESELINAYVLDPAHIAPSRTDANSNGHFPQANGTQPTGTPRGFNLQNFNINQMLQNFPGIQNMAGIPPMFANFPGGAGGGIAGWAGGPGVAIGGPGGSGGSGTGPEDGRGGMGGTGPVRRGGMMGGGGGRFQNRAGPYDRRQNQRWGGEAANGGGGGRGRGGGGIGGGNMMGGMGMGMGGPAGGRWGDGAAGGAAVGPREAVQGRSLKSYEDLDHVAGGGGGELNY